MSPPDPADRLELLAPARDAEIGRAAILHGADAVYIGGPAFGARHNAGNPMRDIAALAEYAHRFHARVYVTLNTILHDAELEAAGALAHDCYAAGVDALIIQDMGLLQLDLPPIALHASTQCDIRSPAKARFLSEAGLSQLVVARELSIAEVAAVRAAVPARTLIEYFVHGALCVAYSGQCYLSHAHTGRSANRGDCSQACRLPYSLHDEAGRVVAFERHLLSLKDNDQSANLEALIDAGVRSFKIEGRYKDATYVRNVTGHYRRLLDAIVDARPGLARASSGRTRLGFTPDPDKSFHRGATDYFARGRQAGIGAFDAPAFVGTPLGSVTRVDDAWFELEAAAPLANGDGLAYLDKRRVTGLRASRVEATDAAAKLWRVWPNEPLAALPGLRPGTPIHRNRDQAWEQTLARARAERRIEVSARFAETPDGFTLHLADSDGLEASASAAFEPQPARRPDTAEALLREQFARLGNTEFELRDLVVEWRRPWFVPPSLANRLRQEAVERLRAARREALVRPPRLAPASPPAAYPAEALTYLANVYNRAARAFYARHGVTLVAAAYEAHEEPGEVSLMITRHCLRHAFSLCPKQAKGVPGVQGQVSAQPMTLINGKERLSLRFDCKACEMHVVGQIKKHVLGSAPAGAADTPR